MDEKLVHSLYKQAQAKYLQGHTADALGILTQLSLSRPQSRIFLHGRAMCLASLRRFDEALTACDQLQAVGGGAEADQLRARIAEHQIALGLRETLLTRGLAHITAAFAIRRMVQRNAVVAMLLACCLLMGFLLGMRYGLSEAARMESPPAMLENLAQTK